MAGGTRFAPEDDAAALLDDLRDTPDVADEADVDVVIVVIDED